MKCWFRHNYKLILQGKSDAKGWIGRFPFKLLKCTKCGKMISYILTPDGRQYIDAEYADAGGKEL